ncbi:hypothetical protein BD626DRAFT_564487 [Schizophyllum amplum]|uniref:BTB domain-containing protein n=1 Tax=Schizophyllum amplum TaxID=97359 RepID=A0A550CS02_9AGAR|nr:hypothetical protein BD626DRAFT_564487 [Auriculariopsis ampla]
MDVSISCTRDPDLWFDDGNIVIQVAPRLFRVHRSILALSSSFFRDMLAFPRAAEQDMYEDVPLVVLRDDDARDTAHFLKALYIPHYFLPPPASTTFQVIEGVLRMAHKYDVPALRRCALHHLSITFITDVDNLKTDPERTYDFDDTTEGDEGRMSELKAVIALAHDVGATWLLPSAYYDTMQFLVTELGAAHYWNGRQRRLTYEDLLVCLAGYKHMSKRSPIAMFTSMDIGCGGADCLVKRVSVLSEDDLRDCSEVPLTYWSAWLSDDGSQPGCHLCLEGMRILYHLWQADVWTHLPSYFNLPDWVDLLALMRRDLEGSPGV